MRRCAAILSSLIALSGVAAGDTYYVATNGLNQCSPSGSEYQEKVNSKF